MMMEHNGGLITAPYHTHEHPFEPYEQALRETDQSKLEVPKSEVPSLPSRFEEHYPATGMQDEDAQASYRDNWKEDSVHVIEYSNHWEIHIDAANPRHRDKQLEHLMTDAPATLVLLIAVIALFYYYN